MKRLSFLDRIELGIYHIAIFFYSMVIAMAQYFNPKAKLFTQGRKQQKSSLETFVAAHKNSKILWMHCASLGEFEQGRPLIESLKKQEPNLKIALTFFSPSGYEIRKNYEHADWIGYIPLDTKSKANAFINLLQPDWAIFVKYEFWLNHLIALQQKNIPTFLVAAVFRPQQIFFSKFGGLFRKVLNGFDQLFVQNVHSKELLKKIGIYQVEIAGDPRIDSVIGRKNTYPKFPLIDQFVEDSPTLIIGSSWLKDMEVLQSSITLLLKNNWKIIIAPHDVSQKNVEAHRNYFPDQAKTFEAFKTSFSDHPILIIDHVGILSALYQYGQIAYIGGGFGEGIHSTLEPAAFYLPVLFGPKYQKFIEATQFVKEEGAFSVSSEIETFDHFSSLLNAKKRQKASAAIKKFMDKNEGSTVLILDQLNIRG